jgi:hypothetical protein
MMPTRTRDTGMNNNLPNAPILFALALMLGACGAVEGNSSAAGPVISSVSPDRGPIGGGVTVSITGRRFDGREAIVVVGDRAATATIVSSGLVEFELPPGERADQPLDVTVITDTGFGVSAGAFIYNPKPAAKTVSPRFIPGPGGVQVTITGAGFEAADPQTTTVFLGGSEATDVTVVDDRTITVTASQRSDMPFQPLDVHVTNANGTAVLPQAVQYTGKGLILADNARDGNFDKEPKLVYVDPVNQVAFEIGAQLIGAGIVGLTGLTFDGTGRLFALTNSRGLNRFLLRVDPGTFNMAEPTNLFLDGTSTRHAVATLTFSNGDLFGYSRSFRGLIDINPATSTFTTIGASAASTPRSPCLAHNPLDLSTLFFMASFAGTLDTINKADSVVTAGPSLNGAASQTCHDMTFFEGALYVIRFSTNDRRTADLVSIKIDSNKGIAVDENTGHVIVNEVMTLNSALFNRPSAITGTPTSLQ